MENWKQQTKKKKMGRNVSSAQQQVRDARLSANWKILRFA